MGGEGECGEMSVSSLLRTTLPADVQAEDLEIVPRGLSHVEVAEMHFAALKQNDLDTWLDTIVGEECHHQRNIGFKGPFRGLDWEEGRAKDLKYDCSYRYKREELVVHPETDRTLVYDRVYGSVPGYPHGKTFGEVVITLRQDIGEWRVETVQY